MVRTAFKYIFSYFSSRSFIQNVHLQLQGWVKGTLIGFITLFSCFVIVYKLFLKVEVKGTSMVPTLEPGDRLVIAKLKIHIGDLVVIKDSSVIELDLVKRVNNIFKKDGVMFYEVIGDNLGFSTDSRHFGPISSNHIVGKVVYRYAPNGRSGFIRSYNRNKLN